MNKLISIVKAGLIFVLLLFTLTGIFFISKMYVIDPILLHMVDILPKELALIICMLVMVAYVFILMPVVAVFSVKKILLKVLPKSKLPPHR